MRHEWHPELRKLNLGPKHLGESPNRAEDKKVSLSKSRYLEKKIRSLGHLFEQSQGRPQLLGPDKRARTARWSTPHLVWPLPSLFLESSNREGRMTDMHSEHSLRLKIYYHIV